MPFSKELTRTIHQFVPPHTTTFYYNKFGFFFVCFVQSCFVLLFKYLFLKLVKRANKQPPSCK